MILQSNGLSQSVCGSLEEIGKWKTFQLMRYAGSIAIMSIFAASIAAALPLTEKLSRPPKFVYRQIGGGYTLALEKDRQPKTFFVCAPNKINCLSTKEIGWQKPFIIYRTGDLMRRSGSVIDTTGRKHSKAPKFLQKVPCYPAAAAWEKLSPTRPLW
jgi:hypothetical protein